MEEKKEEKSEKSFLELDESFALLIRDNRFLDVDADYAIIETNGYERPPALTKGIENVKRFIETRKYHIGGIEVQTSKINDSEKSMLEKAVETHNQKLADKPKPSYDYSIAGYKWANQ
jgi:hypothetical protein